MLQDCAPTAYVPFQWNSLTRGGQPDVAFYVYTDIALTTPFKEVDFETGRSSINFELVGASIASTEVTHPSQALRVTALNERSRIRNTDISPGVMPYCTVMFVIKQLN